MCTGTCDLNDGSSTDLQLDLPFPVTCGALRAAVSSVVLKEEPVHALVATSERHDSRLHRGGARCRRAAAKKGHCCTRCANTVEWPLDRLSVDCSRLVTAPKPSYAVALRVRMD